MTKRTFIFGNYNTAAHGWTLTGWNLSDAQQKTNRVDKPGGDGSWDLSTVTTDGIPRYSDRDLTVFLECSEGTRLHREDLIREMANKLDGLRWDIELPDDEFHHMSGRVHVAREYNDLAHCAVTVTAVCDPWKYSNSDTVIRLTATAAEQTAELVNNGRRAVVPVLTVAGEGANIRVVYGSSSLALGAGVHQWADLLLTPGSHRVTYSGTGTLAFSYREAVLE